MYRFVGSARKVKVLLEELFLKEYHISLLIMRICFFRKLTPIMCFYTRTKDDVVQLLNEQFERNKGFISIAVKGNYGEKYIPRLKYTVLIKVPRQIRHQHIEKRSYDKFGRRMQLRGDLYESENKFLNEVLSLGVEKQRTLEATSME